jgi:GNAT superfamily N-acetyltransferase
MPRLRLATPADLAALRQLIDDSVRGLSVRYYSTPQIENALRHLFGPDSQLIADESYYVIEHESDGLVAAGGWSRRRTTHGGDQAKDADDPLLDPAHDAARIRAYFVHPDWARRGLARQLFERCAVEASKAGFRRLELISTLPGEPLYRALGFAEVEQLVAPLPDGPGINVIRMVRDLPR